MAGATSCHSTALGCAPAGRGASLPSPQAPPLPWAAFPSSHPTILTNPEWGQLAGLCHPHSLPRLSLRAHLVSTVGSLARGARCRLSWLSSNSDSWHPSLLHTLSSLLWHSTQLPHSQPYAHPRPQRNSTYIPTGWDVQKTLTICEPWREPAVRKPHQAIGCCRQVPGAQRHPGMQPHQAPHCQAGEFGVSLLPKSRGCQC